ncbi:MAG: flagellar biosynthesis protein FlhF [Pirellulales bacterium]|nr:flagellar biosynthesis protein FlhF [Pirellulales bacterium]
MNIKTFRARSLQEALDLVRRDLGPDAAILHTREVSPGIVGRMLRLRQFEVAASASVNVPSRLPERMRPNASKTDSSWKRDFRAAHPFSSMPSTAIPAHLDCDYRAKFRDDFKHQVQDQLDQLTSLVEDLCQRKAGGQPHELPEALFQVFTDMIEADVDEETARDLVERVRVKARPTDLVDPVLVMSRVASLLEEEIHVTGPVMTPPGKRQIVALVGPTGVGKTTTIAKLAANYRLREKKRVGLITVDTYRIAAVEQLRTYADIIDLPMEVVATPREMREAVARLADLDLVLMDTAGRSPRDEVKIQELKSMLGEAHADEVHLVLSSTAGTRNLTATAEQFQEVGTTALLLTKLDEATSFGNLLGLVRQCPLPLSYLTDGQNVPDDIEVAQPRPLAQMMLGKRVMDGISGSHRHRFVDQSNS